MLAVEASMTKPRSSSNSALRPRLALARLLVGQVIVHPAAALQLRRPARGGNLQDVGHDQRLPPLVLLGPGGKWQRLRVDADGGAVAAGQREQTRRTGQA